MSDWYSVEEQLPEEDSLVVVGHSPQTSINVIGNHIYIDNGFWFRNVEPTIYSAKELRQILHHFKG